MCVAERLDAADKSGMSIAMGECPFSRRRVGEGRGFLVVGNRRSWGREGSAARKGADDREVVADMKNSA